MSSRHLIRVKVLVAALLPLGSDWVCAADGVTVFTRGGLARAASWKLAPDLGVELAEPGRAAETIKASDLLALCTDGTAAPSAGWPRVALRNGEIIAAKLAADQAPGSLAFDSPLWGRLQLPMDHVAAYSTAMIDAGEQKREAPRVLLRNGDVVSAEVKAIGSGALTVSTEFGDTEIALDNVASIVLSADSPPVDGRQGRAWLVELVDGQRFYCQQLSPDGSSGVALRRGDGRCELDRARLRRIVWPGATTARVSTMDFTAEGKGYFGRELTARRDVGARGQPLQLGHRRFSHGVSTRPRSRVAFQLGGRWAYLDGRVGLDPVLGASGDCVVAVAAGGKEAFRAQLRGEAHHLALPLAGAGELELRTDFGPRGDLGDYVNWCDLLLIGEREGTEK